MSEAGLADTLRSLLTQHRWLAIVRETDVGRARESVRALVEAGVPLVEVTLTTPGALDIIREERQRARAALDGVMPNDVESLLGAGTVLTAVDAGDALSAGAQFLVTPHTEPAVVAAADSRAGVLLGAFTPTEILVAAASGATAVKLFPALAGGPAYVGAVHAALPDVGLVPTGGVNALNCADYLNAGAIAVAVGAWLTGNPDKVSARAAEMRDAVSFAL